MAGGAVEQADGSSRPIAAEAATDLGVELPHDEQTQKALLLMMIIGLGHLSGGPDSIQESAEMIQDAMQRVYATDEEKIEVLSAAENALVIGFGPETMKGGLTKMLEVFVAG